MVCKIFPKFASLLDKSSPAATNLEIVHHFAVNVNKSFIQRFHWLKDVTVYYAVLFPTPNKSYSALCQIYDNALAWFKLKVFSKDKFNAAQDSNFV